MREASSGRTVTDTDSYAFLFKPIIANEGKTAAHTKRIIMKKFLLSLAVVLTTLPTIARDFFYEYEGNKLIYRTLDEKTCQVGLGEGEAAGNNLKGALIIPSVAVDKNQNKEYTVVEIAADAFDCCEEITSAVVPNTVTTMGTGVFATCTKLKSVVIGNSVTSIEDYTFYECEALESVTLGNSLISIAGFEGCTSLKQIALPNSLKTISHDAFRNCRALTSIVIPNSVTSIGMNAFSGCTSLTSVTFSNALTQIDDYAFSNCRGLTSIDLPASLTGYGYGAFSDCSGLTSIKIPNTVTMIEDYVFAYCTALKEIILPPSVTSIKSLAFYRDVALETIKMGCNIKTIEEEAFDGCPASAIYITAQTPPDAQLNTFSNYEGKLYLQGQAAVTSYANADVCWDNFKGTVMSEPTAINVNRNTINGKPGDTFQLTAALIPDNVSLPHIFWRSTNTEIATVDNNGLVTLQAGANNVSPAADGNNNQETGCKIIAETLYHNGPTAEITVNDSSSAIDNIVYDAVAGGDIDFSAPFEVYNLQGVKVGTTTENLTPGIYIIRQNNITKKVIVQ